LLRRKKIPHQCKQQRNCQLFIVLASIVITLATSFTPNVDWAAHAGGALQVKDRVHERVQHIYGACGVVGTTQLVVSNKPLPRSRIMQGVLWGIGLLSSELDHERNQVGHEHLLRR
jgi:hypothetical protein